MSGADRARRCESCGAEIGLTGPCPDCGILPSLEVVVGVDEAPSSTVAQVTLPRRKQRTAAVVVAVVVALVAMSVMWDPGSGDDATAESEEAEDSEGGDAERAEPTQPDGGRDPGPGANPPSRSEPVHEVGPLPGFEDQWLLVVDQMAGRVMQVPLGGGEVVEVLSQPSGSGSVTMSFPASVLLVDGVLIGGNSGMSLLDGTRWELGGSIGEWEHTVGVTSGGTLITAGSEVRERSLDGELLESWNLEGLALAQGRFVAVIGRSLFQVGPYGLLSFDLDTGSTRRVAQGLLVATEGDVMAVSVCDDELDCEIELRHGTTGWTISRFEFPAPVHGYGYVPGRSAYSHRPSLSPDLTRLVLTDPDRGLVFFDTRTGDLVGSVELPEPLGGEWSQGVVDVLWAPSSEAALVIISDGVRANSVLQVDRDAATVEARQQLADAISTASRGGDGLVLSDRGFNPVDPEPQP